MTGIVVIKLRRLTNINLLSCVTCKEKINTKFYEPIKSQLLKRQLCFNCNFWYDRLKALQADTDHRCAVIDGDMYNVADSKNTDIQCNGFAGRKFTIRFHDGFEVTTNNLWHNGAISPFYIHLFKQNAVFINGGTDF